jgi:Tol biopolymer transport system component
VIAGLGQERTPAWSPDRTRIAFAGSPAGGEAPLDIYVVGADATGLVRLTHGPRNDEDPSWSPDGTRIVFTTSDRSTGRTRIALVNVDGSPAAQLPEPPSGCIDREPAWSPNGMTLAFARMCGSESSRLFLIRLDGTGLFQLEDSFGRTPAWSPDGSKLAYTGWGTDGPAIFIAKADGSGKVQLTPDGTGDPAWSPDGSRIAFIAGGLALRLFVVGTDGRNERPITHGLSNEVMPAW